MYKNRSAYPKLRSNLFFSHVWHLKSYNISLWPQNNVLTHLGEIRHSTFECFTFLRTILSNNCYTSKKQAAISKIVAVSRRKANSSTCRFLAKQQMQSFSGYLNYLWLIRHVSSNVWGFIGLSNESKKNSPISMHLHTVNYKCHGLCEPVI